MKSCWSRKNSVAALICIAAIGLVLSSPTSLADVTVVDDFDSYADNDAIKAVWKDYWADTASKNGATVFVETDPDFVRDGNSMKYYYMNSIKKGPGYAGSWAEADTADLQAGTDWTVGDANALVLYFYGDPCNGKDTTWNHYGGVNQDQMWVALEDGSNNEGFVKYSDMNDIRENWWHEWNINLQDFNDAGVVMSDVSKISLGFGGPRAGQSKAGAGMTYGIGDTVYFEDIRLYPSEPANAAPVACIIGGDRTVEAGSGCEARVTLDGSCSSDADSTPGTNDDIEYFDWYEQIDPCDPNSDIFLGSGEVIECNLPLGEHVIVLEVIDKAGAFDVNELTITVEDTTPPAFSLSVEPDVLWPPNHKMVEITPSWEVSDNCDESLEVTLVSITMNEDDDGKGDGHTSDDIQVDDKGIWLRAERSGRGTGRVYTITYQAADDSGNVTVQEATVTVPHNRRKN
jgi:hypothetical protein